MSMKVNKVLPSPAELKEEYPLSEKLIQLKKERDAEIRDIFTGKSDKFAVIIGPCSADNEDSVIVIGADTIVYHKGEILTKPKNEEDAFRILKSLEGQIHQVYTGVTICSAHKNVSFYEKTDVWVYDMTDEEIRDYISTGEPMDKAGAYGIQGKFAAYIKGIEHCACLCIYQQCLIRCNGIFNILPDSLSVFKISILDWISCICIIGTVKIILRS